MSQPYQVLQRVELERSWERAWKGIGAKANGAKLFEALITQYCESHRKYHTLQHLSECLSLFETVQDLATHASEIEVALWFHDAIYDLERSDNEEQSALWARDAAVQSGVAPEVADRISSLIRVTKHPSIPTGIDEQLLVDLDLAILGASQARFAEYDQQIREEYQFVPDRVFQEKRCAILQSFLDRDRIYNTSHFHTLLEGTARTNLAIALDR